MHGALFSDGFEVDRPESFRSVVQLLRDAATLSISENLGADFIKTMTHYQRKKLTDRLS
jgi:hypothetical protein